MIKKCIVLIYLLFTVSLVHSDDSILLKTAEDSARTWFSLIDQAKYQESWEKAAPVFKSKQNEVEWIKTITSTHSVRGAASARYIAAAGLAKSLSGLPDGDYIVLQFYATYAKGLALETITLTRENESDITWMVADYSIK